MSILTSNINSKTTTLDATTIRENLSYLAKVGLPPSIAQHINTRLIFHDVHIDYLTTASNIELHSWVLMCLETYQFSKTLVLHRMQKLFRDKFHRWRYMKFSKLDQLCRGALKETFMPKTIYMNTGNNHVNQRLTNLISDEKLTVWDETRLVQYILMYLTSKAWVFFELLNTHPSRQISPSVKKNFNPINNR